LADPWSASFNQPHIVDRTPPDDLEEPAKGRRGKAAPIKLDDGPFRIDSGGRDLSKHGVDLTPWVRKSKPKGTIVVSDQIMRDLFAGLVASGVAADGGNC
jgi:hypothetical protein